MCVVVEGGELYIWLGLADNGGQMGGSIEALYALRVLRASQQSPGAYLRSLHTKGGK